MNRKSCLDDVIPRENIANRRGGYSGSSKKNEAKRFIGELKRVSESTGQREFSNQELYKVATEMRIQMTSFQDLIDFLNLHGFLLKKGNQRYKLTLLSC